MVQRRGKMPLAGGLAILFMLGTATGWQEFGRSHPVRKRVAVDNLFSSTRNDHLNDEKELWQPLEEADTNRYLRDLVEEVLSMSMSFSMSMGYDDGDNPSGGEGSSPSPSFQPSPSPSNIPSDEPSLLPSGLPSMFPSPIPSRAPSHSPTHAPIFTPAPTTLIAPTIAPQVPATVPPSTPQPSSCPTDSIRLTTEGDPNAIEVLLAVGYLVESTADSTDVYLDDLEDALLETAIDASTTCPPGSNQGNIVTSFVGDCTPTVATAQSCAFLESTMTFFIVGNTADSDLASFQGYSAIQNAMNDGSYLDPAVVTVVNIQYLSPLPIVAPENVPVEEAGVESDPTTGTGQNGGGRNASPWTIGATVATIMGGAISIYVWNRTRAARNRRHMRLLEDLDANRPEEEYERMAGGDRLA